MKNLTHSYHDLEGGQWLRGNLHTHTLQSDGARPPQEVIDDYAKRGYDFLMISDHDIVTAEPQYCEWESRGMVLIPGNEVSRGGPHLQHVDATSFINPNQSRQGIMSDIDAAAKASGRGFSVVNHPNWGNLDHASVAQMREWTGYIGMEIYNGVITFLNGSPYATDKWDVLLSEGRRIWGFANDDSHAAHHVAMGWNVAYAKERTVAAVVEALRTGRFYASTGVVISSISVKGATIRIETANARRINALQDHGKRFASVDSNVIEVEVPNNAKYVRFECWGDGESFAWTQPFYIEEEAEAEKTALEFLDTWQVSPLQEGANLAAATPAQAAALASTTVVANPAKHGSAGFVSVQRIVGEHSGIVYLSTTYKSDTDGARVLKLGYDGPVRVWVNGTQVLSGPGTNPALRDRVAVYADFKQGSNEIVIALDSNGGKAWGIYARVDS